MPTFSNLDKMVWSVEEQILELVRRLKSFQILMLDNPCLQKIFNLTLEMKVPSSSYHKQHF